MASKILVPQQFLYSPFYEEDDYILQGARGEFFYYDIANSIGWDELKPWEDKREVIPSLFQEWKLIKEQLVGIYEKRNRKKARPLMLKGLASFIDILFWTNGKPVHRLNTIVGDLSSFSYKPVNIEERLSYLLTEIDHFHAFNQLKALYEELEKIYYKSMIGNY